MNYYAVINNDNVEFVGSWIDCNKYTENKAGDFQILLCWTGIFPTANEDLKSKFQVLQRDLEQYQMLYKVTNEDYEQLIEKNSDLITLVTSMSNFITTHMEGR